MGSGRTFDIGETSARDPSAARNNVQVTLISEQVPTLQAVEDNMSETDFDDWAEKIYFDHLTAQTIQKMRRQLLDRRQLLPLMVKVLNMVANLRDQYFYEFELANCHILVT